MCVTWRADASDKLSDREFKGNLIFLFKSLSVPWSWTVKPAVIRGSSSRPHRPQPLANEAFFTSISPGFCGLMGSPLIVMEASTDKRKREWKEMEAA